MKRSCQLILALSGVVATQLSAQQPSANSSRISLGVLGGTWSMGDGKWPFFQASVDFSLTPNFVIGATAGAVSRPEVLCNSDFEDPICDRRKLIRMAVATARFEPTHTRLRPYLGLSAGKTWYNGNGSVAGLHGGLALSVLDRLAIRMDAAWRVIADNGIGGATTLQAGAFIRL